MATQLGMNAKAYYNTGTDKTDLSGTSPASVWTLISNITSVDVNNSRDTADVTVRGNNGYRAFAGTLAQGEVTFEVVYDSTDAFFTALQDAYENDTTLVIWFGTGEIDGGTEGDQIGMCAGWSVTNFSESQALEDVIRYSVTLNVRDTTPTPGYYQNDGTTAPSGIEPIGS